MSSSLFPQVINLRTALVSALSATDELLGALSADPVLAEESLQSAVLAVAREECGSTAYYMYVRMQRKLEQQGFGHVKRRTISSLLLHAGWSRKRTTLGIFWLPPTES